MDLMHTAHVPAGEGPFPTIIALHGWGASAHDLLGLAPYLHGGEAVVLCPQGAVEVPVGPGVRGYGWFPLTGGGPPDPAAMVAAREQLRHWVGEALEKYPVDRRHVVALGFSQGGVMAYELALRDPASFAGLVALSAWLPADLANAIPPQDAHELLPTLVIHGAKDPMIPVQRAQESRQILQAKLGIDATYREFEMQHEINADALRTLVTWLEEKVFSVIQLV